MSKLTEQLRTVGIYNPHGFAGHGNVVIDYHPETPGRGYRPTKWIVFRPGFKTNPDAHWTDNYCKVFHPFTEEGDSHKEKKDKALIAAKEWASEKYGIKEWAKTPFGSWMDAEFVKSRLAELKAQIASGQSQTRRRLDRDD